MCTWQSALAEHSAFLSRLFMEIITNLCQNTIHYVIMRLENNLDVKYIRIGLLRIVVMA